LQPTGQRVAHPSAPLSLSLSLSLFLFLSLPLATRIPSVQPLLFSLSLSPSFSLLSSLRSTLLALLFSCRFSADQLFLLLLSSLSLSLSLFLPSVLSFRGVSRGDLPLSHVLPASPLAAPPWYSSLINCVYTAVNSYRCLAPANWSSGLEFSRASTRPQRRHTPGVSSV